MAPEAKPVTKRLTAKLTATGWKSVPVPNSTPPNPLDCPGSADDSLCREWRSHAFTSNTTRSSDGKIRAYTIPGDKHRYVDLDEVRKFRQPRPIEPKLEQ